MRHHFNLTLILLLAFGLPLAVGAVQETQPPQEVASPGQTQDTLDTEAKAIEQLLISPCCWTQPVSDHYSGISWEIRDEIRERLAEGQNRQQIVDGYVQEYGRRILSAPRRSGFDSLAYYLPVLFLAAGAVLCYAIIRKLRVRNRAVPVQSGGSEAVIDERYSKILEKELME